MEAEPAKKRKRCYRERLNAVVKEDVVTEGKLFPLLMACLAQGIMSGVLCHRIAVAAVADMEAAKNGWDLQELNKISSVVHSRNLSSVVEQHMRKTSDLPAPLEVPMTYNTGEKAKAAILAPHEYFAAMFQNKEWWGRSILADASILCRFWNVFKSHPCMNDHPIKSKKNWETWAIPLMFYGDEVPVVGVGKVWSRCVILFEWFSLCAQAAGAATEDVMQYMWGTFEQIVNAFTMETFWRVVKWSFTALATGKWPSHDWAGVKQLEFYILV